jgi:hypothetical protein
MVDSIRRVLIKHPKDAYKNQVNVAHQSPQLNYFGVPDFEKALADYDTFAGLLESFGAEIIELWRLMSNVYLIFVRILGVFYKNPSDGVHHILAAEILNQWYPRTNPRSCLQ